MTLISDVTKGTPRIRLKSTIPTKSMMIKHERVVAKTLANRFL